MNKIHYRNSKTGEYTNNHVQAVKWFNEGVRIDLIRQDTGELVTHWAH